MNRIFYNRWYTLGIIWILGVASVILAVLGISKYAQEVNNFLDNRPQSYVNAFNATTILLDGKNNASVAIGLGLTGLILGALVIIVGAITFFIPRKMPKTFFETSSIVLKKRFINYGIAVVMTLALVSLIISVVGIVFGYSKNLEAISEYLVLRNSFETATTNGSIQMEFSTLINEFKNLKLTYGSAFLGEIMTLTVAKIAIDKGDVLNTLISNNLVTDLISALAFFDSNPTLFQFPDLNQKIITIKQIISLMDDVKYFNNTLKGIIDNDLVNNLVPTFNNIGWNQEIKASILAFAKLAI